MRVKHTALMDPTIAANRAHWNAASEDYQRTHDPAIGAEPKLWGVHAISDELIGAIGPTAGLDVLEYGCGAAQWTASLNAEGANAIGIDVSDRQLAAARLRNPDLRLVQAAGQRLPFPADCFDLVFCDHGAMSWADPVRTLPEVARVLRVGGRLVFNVSSPFIEMCWDDRIRGVGGTLLADYFGLYEQAENGATAYTLGYGDWIRALRSHGLAVEDLIEPRPTSATANTYWASEPPDWFTRWPGECLWVTRLEA